MRGVKNESAFPYIGGVKIESANTVIEIRLETSTVLDETTNFQILVKKPSSGSVIWPATQFEDRSQITYTTKMEDFSEPGQYFMQALGEWGGTGRIHHGDPTVLTVGDSGYMRVQT